MQIASSKDKNPVLGEMCFYGVVKEIWDLDYNMFKFVVLSVIGLIIRAVSKLMSLVSH